jgi:hypothetical protein
MSPGQIRKLVAIKPNEIANMIVLTLVGLQNYVFSTKWTEFPPLLLHFDGTVAAEDVLAFHSHRPPVDLRADWA